MADHDADGHFISSRMFKEIQEKIGNVDPKRLEPSHIFRGATRDPFLTCDRAANMDVFLHVRHGSSLIPRNMNWKMTKEEIQRSIIGRRELESPGCDNREMLMAARDKYGNEIDVAGPFVKDGNGEESNGRIAGFIGESVFHNDRQIEDDGLEHEDIYVDLGDDRMEEIEDEIKKRIVEEVRIGLSKK